MNTLLPHITLERGRDPQYSVIWLHGLGADGSDFVPIAEELHLPHAVRYLFPHAPKRPVTLNGGFIMPAWYDIYGADFDTQQDAAGIRASAQQIADLIESEVRRGIAPGRIFLAGFSQGGAIALHTGLRQHTALGGMLALSTYLPLAHTLPQEASAAGLAMPLFMAHGTHDTIVPYALGKASAETLQGLGCTVAWHEYAMAHSVCMEEIAEIGRWLQQRMR